MAKALADMTADELTAFEQKLDKAASTPAGNLPPALSDMPTPRRRKATARIQPATPAVMVASRQASARR